MTGWGKVKDAAEYSGVSVRTLREWLKEGLPHARLKTSTILIKYDCIDQWLSQFEVTVNDVDEIVEKALEDFSNAN
jgi:excisionase family DNA binding protein